jgi:hypothetical protein
MRRCPVTGRFHGKLPQRAGGFVLYDSTSLCPDVWAQLSSG